MSLGSRIEERRTLIGISQAELARRVGVSQSTMNSLINSDARSSRSLHKIARELRTTPAYLEGEIDDPDQDAAPLRELSADQRELVDRFEGMTPADRRAVMQVVRAMDAHGGAAATLHDPSMDFKGRGE